MARYKIKPGDTLAEIAQRFDTTVSKLAADNNISDPDRIFAGNTITVPGKGGGGGGGKKGGGKPKISDEMLDYGFSTEFLQDNGEVRRLIDRAIDNEWTQTKFSDELKQTKWWQNRSDAQREYDLLKVENPGEIDRREQDARDAVRRMAMRLGVDLEGTEVSAIARNWVRNQLTEDAVRNMVGRKYSPGGRPGRRQRENLGIAGRARQQIIELSRNYGFTMSHKRINGMARQIARGVRTLEDFEGFFRERAIDLFPTVAADIREGRTVRDILEPYMQIAAQELGINPNTMNTTASKWLKPLQYRAERGGDERRMTNDEWVRELRSNEMYGFDRTQSGQQVAAQLTMGLEEALGRR